MWNTKVSDLKHKSCCSTFCSELLLQHFCPLLVFESLYKGRRMHFLRFLTFSYSKSKSKTLGSRQNIFVLHIPKRLVKTILKMYHTWMVYLI